MNKLKKLQELQEQMQALRTQINEEKKRPRAEIGERIRLYRKNAKLTQADLADEVGMSQSQLANIESGKYWISVKNLIVICNILNVTSNDILGFEETL